MKRNNIFLPSLKLWTFIFHFLRIKHIFFSAWNFIKTWLSFPIFLNVAGLMSNFLKSVCLFLLFIIIARFYLHKKHAFSQSLLT